ncbi:ATPase [Candidatus Nitrotoga sp. HW29]|uniref:ATP-binding protein n=1 Tax=Candidatus Nitrotoga sp. HW29 TaxID=2886963 RepID=UPI001EF25842|nr:ATP-binding protein [Candidatus Nitrotoga sp. HW29]CAH1905565.1 ATPase [Candidatus Nitrotoga sp. HW29]
MSTADPRHEWTDANQRLMVAELARIKTRLVGEEQESAMVTAAEIRAALSAPSAIDRIVECFGLSAFERDILLLCAGVEMDSNFSSLCATAQNNPQRSYATFSLALATLEEPHWSALSAIRPLRRWRLVEVTEETSLTNARLRIDERVLHFLAGINYLDTRLEPLLQNSGVAATMADVQSEIAQAILKALQERNAPVPVIQLLGDDRDGQADITASVAAELGMQLHILHAEDIPAGVHERNAFTVLWQRESALLSSALLIECRDQVNAAVVTRLAENLNGLLFISSHNPLELQRNTLRFTVNKPDATDQKRLWQQALGSAAQKLNGSLDGVASQYRLSAQTILSTGAEISSAISASDKPDELLWRACRTLGRRQLDDLAQRVEPISRWEDLILPEHQKAILSQIVSHVRNRLKVCDEWGFARKSARGMGLSTLFAGESGTGKTMAAEVLANELHLDLYRIDLSSVVSKYIGETEKNLRKVFDAAEDSGAILLFDEADALFGKRSEVKDSHDRHANIEVSYLLQRMEAYTGLAILTTNLKTSLDTAFQRRLRFVVQFTFPDIEQREAIWRSVFPGATPIQRLDYRKLAQLQVAGGNIRNIALNAAFLAADAGEAIGMVHLLHAAHGEGSKRERPLTDAETRGWV